MFSRNADLRPEGDFSTRTRLQRLFLRDRETVMLCRRRYKQTR